MIFLNRILLIIIETQISGVKKKVQLCDCSSLGENTQRSLFTKTFIGKRGNDNFTVGKPRQQFQPDIISTSSVISHGNVLVKWHDKMTIS